MINAQKPIPPDWAYSWIALHPETRLRKPAERCPLETRGLFCFKYRAKYGDGMLLKPAKRRLESTYRPASAGFFGATVRLSMDVPDITAYRAPVNKLRELFEESVTELEA